MEFISILIPFDGTSNCFIFYHKKTFSQKKLTWKIKKMHFYTNNLLKMYSPSPQKIAVLSGLHVQKKCQKPILKKPIFFFYFEKKKLKCLLANLIIEISSDAHKRRAFFVLLLYFYLKWICYGLIGIWH